MASHNSPPPYAGSTPRLLQWLVEPPASVQGAARRRQSRLLNIVILSIFIGLLLLLATRTAPGTFPLLAIMLELVMIAALYVLNRQGYYLLAASLLIALLTAHPLVTGLVMPNIDLSRAAIWVSIAILLSSVLLPMPGMLLVTAAAILSIVAAPLVAPDRTQSLDTNTVPFLVVFSILAVGLTRHRDLLEMDREQEGRRIASLETKLEEERVVSAMALQVARIRSEFVANVSHELRTPLNSILGFSEMMLTGLAGPLDERIRKMADRVHSNGLRLLDLINDILDLSKIEAQKIEISPVAFSPREMAKSWQMQFVQPAMEKGVVIELQIEPDLPKELVGDRKLVERIGMHLLSNAVKFTEQGQIRLSIGVASQATWYIKVEDTGIGIPAQALSFIFDPFRQVDGSSTRRYGGAGVGLTLVHELTRLMGGQLSVESYIGEGSCFTVTLPITIPETARVA